MEVKMTKELMELGLEFEKFRNEMGGVVREYPKELKVRALKYAESGMKLSRLAYVLGVTKKSLESWVGVQEKPDSEIIFKEVEIKEPKSKFIHAEYEGLKFYLSTDDLVNLMRRLRV